MTFEIYFLIRFISKMSDSSSEAKIPSFNFILQIVKKIGHI